MIGKIILDMIEENKYDTKRINHAMKVYSYAKCIATNEGVTFEVQQRIEIAAILHDIGIRCCIEKYGSSGGHLQQKEGPSVAEGILEGYTKDRELIERIKYLIAHHHTYKNIDGIDYQILIEADFLVNAEEENIHLKAFNLAYQKFFKTTSGKRLAKLIGLV